jgi:predicted ester cyclase
MTAKEVLLEAFRRTDAREHDAFIAMMAPDVTGSLPGSGELHGREQFRAAMQPFWQGFSEYRHELTRVLEGGDVAMAEGTWHGVHDGPLISPDGQQLPATGRSVTLRFALVGTRAPGTDSIASVDVYFDQIDFLGQLGVLPEPAAAAEA